MDNKTIKKIMEEESALKVIDDIKNKICDVDLDDICGEKVEVSEGAQKTIFKRVKQAVMCGLVYWDEDENCMIQKLIKPIKSGEVEADKLCYKNQITLGDSCDFSADSNAALLIESISHACARPTQLIGKLSGQDFNIAVGCLSFFDR